LTFIGGRYYTVEHCGRVKFCEPTCDECGGQLLLTQKERFDFDKEYNSYGNP